jgi:hypothetical protein
MATPVTTRKPCANRSLTRVGAKRALDTSAKRSLRATQLRSLEDRGDAASNAVAIAFARIVAERYPGTRWLPVKSCEGDNGLIVPAGKVIRLLPGPANTDTSGGIGHPATPAACEGTAHKHSADPGA